MPFKFCDSMCHEYWEQGYVVFRRILPATLLRDLRPEADKIRALAHEKAGPAAQRLQPVVKYGDRINLKPFHDYAELPELRDAVQRLLGSAAPDCEFVHTSKGMNFLGVLVEPTNRPRFHGWHRDGVDKPPVKEVLTPDEIAARVGRRLRPTSDNQINCAIYPDSCLWFVPGSHLRIHNLPGEVCDQFTGKNRFAAMQGSDAEVERACLEACYNFPGAVRLNLDPGDFAIYRSSAWHNGFYLPTQPRATIHDVPTDVRSGVDVLAQAAATGATA